MLYSYLKVKRDMDVKLDLFGENIQKIEMRKVLNLDKIAHWKKRVKDIKESKNHSLLEN